jgi:hypothetical protein
MPSILVATWENGLFRIDGASVRHELAGRSVRGLADDGDGGVLAIVDGRAVQRRSRDGAWCAIATVDLPLSCCVKVGDAIFVGTDDARMLRIDRGGAWKMLAGFEAVPGRESWYAGSAMVDGRLMGPPLGIRSLAASCDGAVLLANIHVGGIARSTDGGAGWQPTVPIDADVHQVCTHPARPDFAIAAAGAGLCVSRDGGARWTILRDGLHAAYCSAVAFGRHDIFVAASTDHFAARGALYRRPIGDDGPLRRVDGAGLPEWLDGIADTDCIAARGEAVAVIDRSGRLYVSEDDGASWSCPIRETLPAPSGLVLV